MKCRSFFVKFKLLFQNFTILHYGWTCVCELVSWKHAHKWNTRSKRQSEVRSYLFHLLSWFGKYKLLIRLHNLWLILYGFPYSASITHKELWKSKKGQTQFCQLFFKCYYRNESKECEVWFWVIQQRKVMHMLFWNRAICFEIIWVWQRRLLPINSNNLEWYANFINPIFIKNLV